MKKNIVIVLLVVVTVLSSVYAFIQQTAAKAAHKQAEMNLDLALKARAEAEQQRAIANEQAMLLQKQMEECKKKD